MSEKSILVLWVVIRFFPVPYRLATCARINTSNWNIAESQSISISCFLGNFEVSDKCWLLHFTDFQQIVTSPSHTRTLYLVNLLAISWSNWVSTCLNLYWKIFFTAKKWLMRICRKRPVADLRGALLARTPMAQNVLNFMQFLGKFDKIACRRPPPLKGLRSLLQGILDPPLMTENNFYLGRGTPGWTPGSSPHWSPPMNFIILPWSSIEIFFTLFLF